MNPYRIEGAEFQVSTKAVPGWDFWYVKPPTNSFDWRGAEWDSPVSLDFQRGVLGARKLGAATPMEDVDASHALVRMRACLRSMADAMEKSGAVLDPIHRVRMTAVDGQIRFKAKVWPAVAGVTVPAQDDTR